MTTKFNRAFKRLIKFEGGYANNKKDAGGETYKGISRKYHPKWGGWLIIDNYKKKYSVTDSQLNKLLIKDKELDELVQEFYYYNYWKKFNGDKLPYIIGEELLEQSVILGNWKTAGKTLQEALNLLNRNGKLFKDLVVDGLVGPKTLRAIKKVNSRRLLIVLNGLEFCKFRESMKNRPLNEVFVGWFDRLVF